MFIAKVLLFCATMLVARALHFPGPIRFGNRASSQQSEKIVTDSLRGGFSAIGNDLNKNSRNTTKTKRMQKKGSRRKDEDHVQPLLAPLNLTVVDGGDSQLHFVVGLSDADLKLLGAVDGDYIDVRSKRFRQAVAVVFLDSKLEKGEARLSKSTMQQLRISRSDSVKILLLPSIPRVKSVRITPFKDSVDGFVGDLFEEYIRPYFSEHYPPLTSGEIFKIYSKDNSSSLPHVEFKVTSLTTSSMPPQFNAENSDTKGNDEKVKDAFGVIGPETEIFFDGDPLDRSEDDRVENSGYSDIGGCRRQLELIRELVELPLMHPEIFVSLGVPPPKGVLLYGPPGSGKTSLVKAIATETGAFLHVINGPEIMSKLAGESESKLRQAFEMVSKNTPAILFIDELDSIAPKRDKAGGDIEKRLVSQLLTLMDGIKAGVNFVVIGATNRPNAIEPALRRFGRFDREIDIGIPDTPGRLEILNIKTRRMQLSKDCDLSAIAKNLHGYVGADIAQLCMEAAYCAVRRKMNLIDMYEGSIPRSILTTLEVTKDDFRHAIQITNPSTLRENVVEIPSVSWSDIGGLEDVKRELQETVQYPLEHAEKFEKFGMKPSKGVLFYGPPGCGKTLLAKAIANECGANFISIKGPELLTMWFGESEANVRGLFDKARAAAPCVLFFDELDSIAKARGGGLGGGSDAGDRVINQILTEIDGIGHSKNVFVIGATNRPDILDSAITRPGRLDQLIYIPLPDFDTRLNIFKANLRKSPVAIDVDLVSLAKATNGFSGADITEICQRAARNAIRESVAAGSARAVRVASGLDKIEKDLKWDPVPFMRRDHFEEAMSRARKSVSDEEVKLYERFSTKLRDDAISSGAGPKFSFEASDDSEKGAEDPLLTEENDFSRPPKANGDNSELDFEFSEDEEAGYATTDTDNDS